EEGTLSSSEMDAAFVGVTRLHVANLLRPLGYAELPNAISTPTSSRVRAGSLAARTLEAERVLDAAVVRDSPVSAEGHDAAPQDGLLGGWGTRAGPIGESALSSADQQTLQRLDFRPVFVGVERRLVR